MTMNITRVTTEPIRPGAHGMVVAVHIDDAIIVDGRVSIERLRPVGRLGYRDYAVVHDGFAKEVAARPALRTGSLG